MRTFVIQRDNTESPSNVITFRVNETLFTGQKDFTSAFGEPSSLESDLLLIAAAIFASDRAYARGERENICRNFEISIPIVNYARLYPLIPIIEKILYRLSNDAWNLKFRQEVGYPEKDFQIKETAGRTLLFSGGLDSLAAAIEFGKLAESLQLVSHKTKNRITDESQSALYRSLKGQGYDLKHYQCFISSRSSDTNGLQHDEENTQRTRSFLFLTLGALMARRSGHNEIIYLAENGQMAIHLPLTHGRIGAFSTHTAHPQVLLSMQEFLSEALQIEIRIINPYVHKTKGEVVGIICSTLPEAIPMANSCWRNSRLPAHVTHCGECIPCFIRRIAIENNLTQDPTRYNRDPWREDIIKLEPNDDARRNLADLCELIKRFERDNDEAIMSEWPELYSEGIKAPDVISMYRRFSTEARSVLGRYSGIGPFLFMKISHAELEKCLLNPRSWVGQKMLPYSAGPRLGYDGATKLAIYKFHATGSKSEAQDHLNHLMPRLRLTTNSLIDKAMAQLDSYIKWCENQSPIVSNWKLRLDCDLGSNFELGGEISRIDLDIQSGGYRGVLLGNRPPDWHSQLRFPLIQRGLALKLQREETEISVGFQNIDGSQLELISLSKLIMDKAEAQARELALVLSNEWRRQKRFYE